MQIDPREKSPESVLFKLKCHLPVGRMELAILNNVLLVP